MDGIWDRKLWHVQKFCVWPEISSGWLGMLRISLAPGHFWTELKIWAGRSRFCSKSQGLALWNKDSPPMILSFLPLHILGYVKSQQTLLVPSPSTARDMRHTVYPWALLVNKFLPPPPATQKTRLHRKINFCRRKLVHGCWDQIKTSQGWFPVWHIYHFCIAQTSGAGLQAPTSCASQHESTALKSKI